MKSLIEIKIKPKHFKNASCFDLQKSCPLGLALKDHFLDVNLLLGYTNLYIPYHKIHNISHNGKLGWYNDSTVESTGFTVDELIKRSKQKKKVGMFTIKLQER
jgi:hypothetical protein